MSDIHRLTMGDGRYPGYPDPRGQPEIGIIPAVPEKGHREEVPIAIINSILEQLPDEDDEDADRPPTVN